MKKISRKYLFNFIFCFEIRFKKNMQQYYTVVILDILIYKGLQFLTLIKLLISQRLENRDRRKFGNQSAAMQEIDVFLSQGLRGSIVTDYGRVWREARS